MIALSWDFGESETAVGGVDLVVHVRRPWWQVWLPRGEVRIVMERPQVIRFYQTLHKHMQRGMIVGGLADMDVGTVLRELRATVPLLTETLTALHQEGHEQQDRVYRARVAIVRVIEGLTVE
jgi:hypothetical protein